MRGNHGYGGARIGYLRNVVLLEKVDEGCCVVMKDVDFRYNFCYHGDEFHLLFVKCKRCKMV